LTAIILQARLDSTRLPGKSLLLLEGKPLVYRVMEALNYVPVNLRILACPEDCAREFSPLAAQAGFEMFLGPKDDVLARFCLVIKHFSVNRVIRATGDNPFVFADAAAALNAEAAVLGADYAGYTGLPVGAGVESVNTAALLAAQDATPYEKEHVCPFLYNHSELFRLHRPLAPLRWQSNFRLTVDTQEDFDRAQVLYRALNNSRNRYYGPSIIERYTEIFN
jgi:spore coat polysaccharide biosynthesis protein SpsF